MSTATRYLVIYNQSLGFKALIERAVGPRNIGNINTDITPERFPLKGVGVRRVLCRVEAYLDGEPSEQAAKRLTGAGHILASTGDLAAFLHDNPEEVKKWAWVLAISEDSRWTDSDGFICVPCADVYGTYRCFDLYDLRYPLYSGYGVLVSSE